MEMTRGTVEAVQGVCDFVRLALGFNASSEFRRDHFPNKEQVRKSFSY